MLSHISKISLIALTFCATTSQASLDLTSEINNMKLSSQGDLVREDGTLFKEYYMLGDGNCGLYSLGFKSHAEAIQLLLDHSADIHVRQKAQHQITADFRYNRLPATMYDTPLMQQWSQRREHFNHMQAISGQLSLHDRQAMNRDADLFYEDIKNWATSEETYKTYVNEVFTFGYCMEYNMDFDGLETEPTFMNVFALIMQKNLEISVQITPQGMVAEGRLPHDNTIHISHTDRNANFQSTIYLISRGGHFNRLVPVNDLRESALALLEEDRFVKYHYALERESLEAISKYLFEAYDRNTSYPVRLALNNEIVQTQKRIGALMLAGIPQRDNQLHSKEANDTKEILNMKGVVAYLFDCYRRNSDYQILVAFNSEIVLAQTSLGALMGPKQ